MEPFQKLATPEKLMMILTISVFLPVYFTVPAILAACGIILYQHRHYTVSRWLANLLPLGFECFAVLVVPLFYRNYTGFLCGILFVLYVMLAVYFNRTSAPRLFEAVSDLLCFLSVPCIAIALFQRFVLNQERMEALTYNSNFYAFMIELIIIVCFYKAITRPQRKWGYLAVAAANAVTLFLTGCRSAWCGLAVGLFALFFLLKKRSYAQFLAVLTAAAAVAISFDHSLLPRYSDFNPTLLNRIYIWKTALDDFAHHPLFGRGLLALYQVTGNPVTPHAHSLYLDVLECEGIVGAVILAAYAILIVRQLVAAYRSGNAVLAGRSSLVLALAAAICTHGVTDIPLMGAQTGLLVVLLIAVRPQVALEYSILQKQRILSRAYLHRFLRAFKKENLT